MYYKSGVLRAPKVNLFVNMASDYTRQWIQFFTGCGIPQDVATTYGLIFNENRIQKNMLLDLNKEYLRDMGITVMGDVIAILRYAKIVHDKYVREQILSDSEDNSPVENNISDSPATKKFTPVKRMLEHYTRKYDSTELNVPNEKVQICIENDNNVVNVPKKLAHRIGAKNKVKQKIEAPSMRSDDLIPGKLEIPVPKLRRVLPENEGNYTIKMPSGTTERSRKLLEKAKLRQNKTVFDRLGESSVSSTSDVLTATGSTKHVPNVLSNKEKNTQSVFSRLGEKSSLVTSTSTNGNSIENLDQLPYKGILKSSHGKRKLCLSPNSTMRADNELHLSNTNTIKVKKGNMVKERLGKNLRTNQSSLPNSSLKMNRLQITTTFEEEKEKEPLSINQPLFKRFKSLKPSTGGTFKERKNILDGLSSFRSGNLQNKSKVTSTTQVPDVQRGTKRRLQDVGKTNDVADVIQSKKVRFGHTTQLLIPGNPGESAEPKEDYNNLVIVTGKGERLGNKTLSLTSGVKIGPMNSDKIRQKLSLRERIGSGSLMTRSGRLRTELERKRSLKFGNRLKKISTSIHDRLG